EVLGQAQGHEHDQVLGPLVRAQRDDDGAQGAHGPTARRSKALDRFGLGIVGLEHRQQLGDREQVLDLFGQVEELEAPALAADGGVAAHDLAQAGRVDVGHFGKVQQDLGLTGIHQLGHGIPQGVVPFAYEDLPVQIQNDDVIDLALDDLHGVFLPAATVTYEG